MPEDVNPYQFDKNTSHKHRRPKSERNYKLSQTGLNDFKSRFPKITSLRGMFEQIRSLDEADDTWYTSQVSAGKISKTSKTAAELGGGQELEDQQVSGFNNGIKTARMQRRDRSGPRSIG